MNRYAPRLALLAALAIVAAACATGSSDSDVRPFEDIAVGSPVITPSSDGRSVRIEVETSLDAVCAVAFGPTEDLGSLATDADMEAGGHENHGPLLTGLEPETTYYYRFQGVGPDGTLYQSELMTLTTPAAAESAGPGPNIAPQGSVVEFSSEFSASFSADRAIDGDLGTEWSSKGDGDDAYIVIDLGAPAEIIGVGFLTREMSDGTSVTTSFTVTVDGERFGPFEAGPGLAIGEFGPVTGQEVRVDVETSTGGNTGAVEMEIYGR